MKQFLNIGIQILVLPLCFFSFSNIMHAENVSVSVVVEHMPPWEIAEDPKKQQVTKGIAVDLAREIFKRYGKEITLKTAPWKRALNYIKTGEADVIPMIIKTKEREKYMVFTDPVFLDPIVFGYTASDFTWRTWEDLKSYKIGIVRGYEYGQEWKIATQKHNLNISESASDEGNIKMLLAQRNELALLYYSVAVEIIKGLETDKKIKFSRKPVGHLKVRFGISKESDISDDISKINNILRDMKKDGTYKKIMGDFYL